MTLDQYQYVSYNQIHKPKINTDRASSLLWYVCYPFVVKLSSVVSVNRNGIREIVTVLLPKLCQFSVNAISVYADKH